MSDWPQNAPVDGVDIAVATVCSGPRGEVLVTACNRLFLQMTGAARAGELTFPIPLDSVARNKAGLELREKIAACFTSDVGEPPAQAFAFVDDARQWRLSFELIKRTVDAATAVAVEILVTGVLIGFATHLVKEHERSAARYRAVVDSAYDGIVAIDQRHNITLFNRAAENLFGYTAAEVLGRSIEMLLPEQFRANHARHVQQFANSPLTDLRQALPPRMDESNSVYGRHRDGSVIPVEISISKIDVDGVTEFTAVVRDITDRAKAMDRLKKQAGTDALTGLPNRRAFLEFVDQALGSAHVFSVFMLDIDCFKQINDSHGHDAGDDVLRTLANVGMSMTHEPCMFARWGGEEFVSALPGADANLALTIAERLRQRIERLEIEHPANAAPIPFTVSIGVVTCEPGECGVEALMKRADQALYQAKKSGRNRVEVG